MPFNICSHLIVLYFENRNWLVVRLKWIFLWFFVSISIFDLRYIIWWNTNDWEIAKNEKALDWSGIQENFEESYVKAKKMKITRI